MTELRDLFADLGLSRPPRPPRLQGRAEVEIACEYVRDLTPEDLAQLVEPHGRQEPALKRLSDSHHAVARALASGMSVNAVSAVTGYVPPRISMLKADPAFQELVEFYRQNLDTVYADLHTRMSLISLDVAQELHERLLDDPGSIGTALLTDILKLLADRTGHAPVSRSHAKVDVTVGFSDLLAEARKREELATKLIEAPRNSWSSDDGAASSVAGGEPVDE